MSDIIAGVVGVALAIGGLFGFAYYQEEPTVGAVTPFTSRQLAPNPTNTYVLTTDGTNNSWAAPGAASADGTWSTTSANHYTSLGLSWSTTSADYWETQQTARTADDLSNDSIEALSDVSAMTENYGDLLYWNGTTWSDIATSSLNYSWTNLTNIPAGFADGTDDTGTDSADDLTNNSIEDLQDVAAMTENLGDLLYWNGSAWADIATSSINLTFSNILGTADISTQTNLTAGDALTLTNDDIDFDGGATPSGDLGGTWASPSVTDDSHAHTGTTISSLDISADTNLTAGDGITLTDDDLDCDTSSATVFGCLSAANWATFNNKWDLASATIPISKGGTGLTALGASSTVLTTNGTIMIWQSIVSYVQTIMSTASMVLTGAWDFGGATSLELPNGSAPTVDAVGEIALDTTSNQIVFATSTTAGAAAVLSADLYASFNYSTTSWSGTTTIAIGPAYVAEAWIGMKCFTNVGTVVVHIGDGSASTTPFSASTTVGTINLTPNNTFTAGEKRYLAIGSPASSPLQLSCTVRKQITRD